MAENYSGMDRLYGGGWREQPEVVIEMIRARSRVGLQRIMDRGTYYIRDPRAGFDTVNESIERGYITPAKGPR